VNGNPQITQIAQTLVIDQTVMFVFVHKNK